jgi:quercetin dioxygenase-like cupin family protein
MTERNSMGPWSLADFPAHLGRNASVAVEPRFDGEDWFEAYGGRHTADGKEGRLVTLFTFSESWTHWEMHPHGSEIVLVTQGQLTLLQDEHGQVRRTPLSAGHYAINPPGVWHTADTEGSVTAVFITAGMGTEHRER